jgi:hypothetical protein
MSDVWQVREHVAWVAGEHRVAVLDLSAPGQLPVVLTDSSAEIWAALDGERDEDGIVMHVADLFEVNEDAIREQVRAFLGDLASRQLIVRT